ncbi:MAG: hypothetical protein R3F22_11495 [Lysobacteraceae bacterium]
MLARVFVVIVFSLAAHPALAAPQIWGLEAVQFDDGGIATGFIEIDSVTGNLLDFNIRVEGGNEGVFPNSAYSAGSVVSQRMQINAHPVDSFVFSGGDGDVQTILRLTPVANLETQAGRVNLDTGFADGNVECLDCSPFRLIVAGSLVNLLFEDGFEGSPAGDGGGDDGDG